MPVTGSSERADRSARGREYQAAIVRLHGRSREDEETVTDLLNERMRMGWSCHAMAPLTPGRLLVIFVREAETAP